MAVKNVRFFLLVLLCSYNYKIKIINVEIIVKKSKSSVPREADE